MSTDMSQEEMEDRLGEIDQEMEELQDIIDQHDLGNGMEAAIDEGLIVVEEEDGEFYFWPEEAHEWEMEELEQAEAV